MERLRTTDAGLAQSEAAERLAAYGPNRLPEPRGATLPAVALAQFRSPFIGLLLAAGAFSLFLHHRADAAFIFGVLLLNAAVGAYQEWRAEKRARALKALIAVSATVRRDNRRLRLPADALVPGDVVLVESGEKLGADLRLLHAQNLAVDESLLTGESVPVYKVPDRAVDADAPLGDRATMLYAGTTVRTGRGTGVVVATAAETVVGRLASTLERPEPPTPLVRRMAGFTWHVAWALGAVVLIFAGFEIARGAPVSDIIVISIALAVSAIPEGLPVAMTVALSIAMHRMGVRHVVVRRLTAVEGLGTCTLIATDKTGTLTVNRLDILRVWIPERGETSPQESAAGALLVAGASAGEPPVGSEDELVGDPVDLAFYQNAAPHRALARDGYGLVSRIPYEPERRFAAAFYEIDGVLNVCVKGAPETVARFCANADDETTAEAERLSAQGYRVIAVASGRVEAAEERALEGLVLEGFAALIDPLRPQAREAVENAQSAGVRVVMITGDHPLTALAVSRELGLAQTRDAVLTGAQLAELNGAAFDLAVAGARVFARIEPLQKLAIVESLRRHGEVVAVTGDGVNDAPALHAADIGVAMGKSGTDVAREAADLIITDDNFVSIVSGIEEGRIAHDNLRKVILLLISTGAAEVLLMLLCTILGLPPPLTPVQLLWLNLITNGIQDVALAFERAEPGVLARPPRPARAPIFDRRMIEQVLLAGATIGIVAFAVYVTSLRYGVPHAAAQGLILWLLVWCENAHALNCRSETRSVFWIPLADNPLLVGAIAGTQALQIAVLHVPALRELLSLQSLSIADGLALGSFAVLIVLVMELYKFVRRTRRGGTTAPALKVAG